MKRIFCFFRESGWNSGETAGQQAGCRTREAHLGKGRTRIARVILDKKHEITTKYIYWQIFFGQMVGWLAPILHFDSSNENDSGGGPG